MKRNCIIIVFLIFILFNEIIFATEDNINISSNTVILMEQRTKRVLYEKNSRKKVKIASTTKILTAIIAIENCDLGEMVEISKNAATTGGSTVGLKSGTKVSMKTLLYGMLLKSGNDCACAIAEHISGSIEEFAKTMNKKAHEIGAKDSHFTNPHGLDTEENYSTAYDLALIMCYAKQNETFNRIINTQSITLDFGGTSKYLANTNRLLFTYEYCIGGKTGYTALANRCLVVAERKDDLEVVAVVLGASTTDLRFKDGKTLLKYGIDNYKMTDVSDVINWYIDIPVYKGKSSSYVKKINITDKLPLKEEEIEKIYISQNLLSKLDAPITKGKYLGNVQLFIERECIYTKNIYLDRDIKKKRVLDYMKYGFLNIFNVDLSFM